MGSAVRVTSAAEGLPRRRFTVAEVEAMVAAGVMEEDERVELIGGELVPMSPKGLEQRSSRAALANRWYRLPEGKVDLAIAEPHSASAKTRTLSPTSLSIRARAASGTQRGQRPPCRRDRQFVAALRYRSQGGALRQFWRSRALGHRRRSVNNPHLPRPGGQWLSPRAGLWPFRPDRAPNRTRGLCAAVG